MLLHLFLAKVGRPRNGKYRKNGNKRVAQPKERATSPDLVLFKMNEKLRSIQDALSNINEVVAVSDIVPLTKAEDVQTSEQCRLNAHDRYIQTVLKELSHLDAIVTLDELGRVVQNCQFEHTTLGLVVIRQGQVISCGNTKCDDEETLEEVASRRVTLCVSDLAKCVSLGKIDFDPELRTLRLNGVAVEMRAK